MPQPVLEFQRSNSASKILKQEPSAIIKPSEAISDDDDLDEDMVNLID